MRNCLAYVAWAALLSLGCGRDRPRAAASTIETIVQGKPFEHTFTVPNTSNRPLVVKRVLTSGGVVTHVDSVIPPDSTGQIALRVDLGSFLGLLNIGVRAEFAGDHDPMRFRVQRRVVLPVELSPQNDFYFVTARGEPAQRDFEIINHLDAPLKVLAVTSSNPAFRTTLNTIDAGRHYQLTVALDSATPVGRYEAAIQINTDAPAYSSLGVKGLALVKGVVNTSLDTLDYSRVDATGLDRTAAAERTVLVRKYRGTDFRVLNAATDLPFLTVNMEPQKQGESYLVHVRIDYSRAPKGRFRGTLRIETNDPSHRQLTLPIRGEIV